MKREHILDCRRKPLNTINYQLPVVDSVRPTLKQAQKNPFDWERIDHDYILAVKK